MITFDYKKGKVAQIVIQLIDDFIKEKKEEGKKPTLKLLKQELQNSIKIKYD
jgi:predicted Rdx family selenoprotein